MILQRDRSILLVFTNESYNESNVRKRRLQSKSERIEFGIAKRYAEFCNKRHAEFSTDTLSFANNGNKI